MRYVLVDRFEELEAGERARAVKCVTRGECFVDDLPFYPPALVLEALLQTGGALTRAGAGPRTMSVLGKVNRASFRGHAVPGDRIELDVSIALSRPEGTLCEGVATVAGREVGRAEFMIVLLPPEMTPPPDPVRDGRRRLLAQALGLPVSTKEDG
ncbi:MAG: hotdog family protein [Planctomycetota bacterium]|jgi:3-hydroxymyristoyl/3-hydroxydecanoyl-(acyl carrier protein) dehydratase